MKNLNIFLLLAILFSSCSVDEEITRNNSDESQIDSSVVFDDKESLLQDKFNSGIIIFSSPSPVKTGIVRSSLSDLSSVMMMNKIINAADLISEEEELDNKLKFYYEGDFLYVTRSFISQVNNQNMLIDSDNCGAWSDCKVSRSTVEEAEYILDMASHSDCFEVLIERSEFFSKVSLNPCN